MELGITNCQEYILAKMALCGELVSKGVASGIPYSKNYILNAVRAMRKRNMIRHYSYRDGRRFYRLNDPAGTNELAKINKNLERHFAMLAGEHGSRYKGDRNFRLRQRRAYELHALFQELGYEIDGMLINKAETNNKNTTLSVFDSEGNLKDIETILRERDPDVKSFISSKALRNYDTANVSLHPRDQMYRAAGILTYGRTQYAVYAAGDIDEVWWTDVEAQFSYQMHRLSNKNLKACTKSSLDTRKKAIIYVPDARMLTELLTNSSGEVKLNPGEVYTLPYYVPLKENAKDITEMLLTQDWKHKLNGLLAAKKTSKDDIADGFMPDGSRMFNLLCCNAKFMGFAAGMIKNSKSTVIIHDWQEDAARTLYGNDVNCIVIDEEAFKILLNAVKMGVKNK